jgi:hypothetical protein
LTNAKAKTAKPQDFIDARCVEEFDESGYIDSPYGRKSRLLGDALVGLPPNTSTNTAVSEEFLRLLIFQADAELR